MPPPPPWSTTGQHQAPGSADQALGLEPAHGVHPGARGVDHRTRAHAQAATALAAHGLDPAGALALGRGRRAYSQSPS